VRDAQRYVEFGRAFRLDLAQSLLGQRCVSMVADGGYCSAFVQIAHGAGEQNFGAVTCRWRICKKVGDIKRAFTQAGRFRGHFSRR